MAEQEPEVVDWYWVDKDVVRHILVVGKPDLPINDVILECGNISFEHQNRIVNCVNACRGLTDDQVAAVRRLVTWWTTLELADIREAHDEMVKLEEVFPQVRAGE